MLSKRLGANINKASEMCAPVDKLLNVLFQPFKARISSYVQRFSARIFHRHSFFIPPQAIRFIQQTTPKRSETSFFFFNTKFFRQVGTCLKIDVPLLFSYAVRLGHNYISTREWLKELATVHSFDVAPVLANSTQIQAVIY
jgi:hypothetical protein